MNLYRLLTRFLGVVGDIFSNKYAYKVFIVKDTQKEEISAFVENKVKKYQNRAVFVFDSSKPLNKCVEELNLNEKYIFKLKVCKEISGLGLKIVKKEKEYRIDSLSCFLRLYDSREVLKLSFEDENKENSYLSQFIQQLIYLRYPLEKVDWNTYKPLKSSQRLTTAIIGTVKSGKSELINSILRKSVAETSYLKDYINVQQYVKRLGVYEYTFYDTPGYDNSSNLSIDKKVNEIISESNSFIYVVDYNKYLLEGEDKQIKKLLNQLKQKRCSNILNFVLVVNKVDFCFLCDGHKHFARIIDFIREKLIQIDIEAFKDVIVLGTSAKYYNASVKPDFELLDDIRRNYRRFYGIKLPEENSRDVLNEIQEFSGIHYLLNLLGLFNQ